MLNESLREQSPNYRETTLIRVPITQTDIDAGARCSCEACPIALALSNRLGARWLADMGRLTHEATGFKILTPPPAHQFMADFDDRVPVMPFEFQIEVPVALIPAHISIAEVPTHA